MRGRQIMIVAGLCGALLAAGCGDSDEAGPVTTAAPADPQSEPRSGSQTVPPSDLDPGLGTVPGDPAARERLLDACLETARALDDDARRRCEELFGE